MMYKKGKHFAPCKKIEFLSIDALRSALKGGADIRWEIDGYKLFLKGEDVMVYSEYTDCAALMRSADVFSCYRKRNQEF